MGPGGSLAWWRRPACRERAGRGVARGRLLAVAYGMALMAAPVRGQDDNHLRDFRYKLIGTGPLIGTVVGTLSTEFFNVPREWRRGYGGLGKRAGNLFAQSAVQATVELGASYWTHEDLHFRRCGAGSAWARVKRVVAGDFRVRRDDGPGHTLAVGRIAGAFAAGQMSRLWMPDRVAGFRSGLGTSGATLGLKVGSDLLREFRPRKR